ncbi:hypothetical protein [Caulobacter sp. S45]|uniref:hypothetical protein n=1 Tax=Caulobacter sp. S45 TaxID=1641861 RepID=UPI00131D5B06|nr:hypothetical protein [Caulobacter sp. S45]
MNVPHLALRSRRSNRNRRTLKTSLGPKVLASILALGVGAQAGLASADPATGAPNGTATPSAYASAPQAAGATTAQQGQGYDRAYADQYARWAARYCVDKRGDTATGAAIGGVLGAVLGSGLAGRGAHLGGALAGGALGATAGAVVGANAAQGPACPSGYALTAGAPAFYYAAGPVYPPPVVYGPGWRRPWIWTAGGWAYPPYPYGYWARGPYWGPWAHPYRRW